MQETVLPTDTRELTRGNVGGVCYAKLAEEVTLRHLLELRAKALGVENQRARVTAQQVAPVGANLAEIVVVLSARGGGGAAGDGIGREITDNRTETIQMN